MPPTDDDYLATARHAMMALEAQLYRSLGLPSPSRDQALAIARQMRDIVARAIAALGVEGAEEIVDSIRTDRRTHSPTGSSRWLELLSASRSPEPSLKLTCHALDRGRGR